MSVILLIACIYFITVFYVNVKNCINLVKDGDKYACVGNCKCVFSFGKNVYGADVILFENVREAYFRPHAAYARYIEGKFGSQRVVFTERCEDENVPRNCALNLLDHVIDSANGNKDLSGESFTSNSSNKPVIRVCSFAAIDLFGVDRNRLKKIPNENETSVEESQESSKENTIQQVLNACFCSDGDYCLHGTSNGSPEFVSIDFDDLFDENLYQ